MSIGEKLRIARENKGVTQTPLSKDTNINNKTLSGYERNISEPDLETIKKLAKNYDVSLDYLLGNSSFKNSITENNNSEVDAFLNELKKEMDRQGVDFNEASPKDIIETYKLLKEFKKKTDSK